MKTPKIGEIWKLTHLGFQSGTPQENHTLWECVNYDSESEEFYFLDANYDYIQKSYKKKGKFFNHNLFSRSIRKKDFSKWQMQFVRFDVNCYNRIINQNIKEIDGEIRELKKEIARYEKEKKLWQARIKKADS